MGALLGYGLDPQGLADAHHGIIGRAADPVVQGAVDSGQRNIHRECKLPNALVLPGDFGTDDLSEFIHSLTLFYK